MSDNITRQGAEHVEALHRALAADAGLMVYLREVLVEGEGDRVIFGQLTGIWRSCLEAHHPR